MACAIGEDKPELRALPYDANLDAFEPSYADLPMELLLEIFSYLTPYDRREAGLSCHRWFEAAHHKAFHDYWLVLRHIQFDANEPPVRMLLQSFHHFPNIQLREVVFQRLGNFFEYFGPHIRRIEFYECDLEEDVLLDILRHLSGLRSLKMCNSWVEFKDVFPLTKLVALRQTLSNVTELSLASMCLSDVTVHRLMEIMPSLRSLCLGGSHIFNANEYKEIYIDNREQLSDRFLTIHYILHLIAVRRASVQRLAFIKTVLAAMGPDRLLEMRSLESSKRLCVRDLTTLFRAQSAHLQHLDLAGTCCTDSCLVQICQQFPRLRVLKLKCCSDISSRGIRQVAQLSQLEVLDVTHCNINDEGLLDGIASKKNKTLRELHIGGLALSERSIIAITENLPELRVLDLGYCFHAMSDLCLQFICRNLVCLRQLELNCSEVSDQGLTGLGMLGEMHRHMQARIGPASGISVGNAQHSARREAASSRVAFSGVSINCLQQLQVLSLHCCESLTDVSLSSFRLLELRELTLKCCNRITLKGIKALVRACPAIEKLDLSDSSSITDEIVLQILLHARRLRDLSLKGCFNLTDKSIDYIACHGRRLRVLNVCGCNRLRTDEIAPRLVNILQLFV